MSNSYILGWRSVSDIDETIRVKVTEWMHRRTATKKAENHQRSLNSNKEVFNPKKTSPNHDSGNRNMRDLAAIATGWNWWDQRGKVVDMSKLLSQASNV